MKSILFNLHDVLLILAIGLSAVLSGLFFRLPGSHAPAAAKRQQQVFASLFFGVVTANLVYTLVFWGDLLRYQLFPAVPYAYMVLSVGGFLLGPALFGYVRLSIHPEYRFSGTQYLHFTPVILALIYLYAVIFRLPEELRTALYLNLEIYQQPAAHYAKYITLEKLSPVVYAAVCGYWLRVAQPKIPEKQLRLLKLISYGTFVFSLWSLLTHLLGDLLPQAASDLMGILTNYLTFALLGAVAFKRYQAASRQTPSLPSEKSRSVPSSAPTASSQTEPGSADPLTVDPQEKQEPRFNSKSIEKITRAMTEQKVYLNPQLTLERFAEGVGISPREASAVINGHFKQNFNDFINRHRIDEVKARLRDTAFAEQTIPEIALASGFNSKATFNRFFKKYMKITPSEYRQHPESE